MRESSPLMTSSADSRVRTTAKHGAARAESIDAWRARDRLYVPSNAGWQKTRQIARVSQFPRSNSTMETKQHLDPVSAEALRAALETHDRTATALMREAQKHLREGCRLSRQLERLEQKGAMT
jgi:hypothetical protein